MRLVITAHYSERRHILEGRSSNSLRLQLLVLMPFLQEADKGLGGQLGPLVEYLNMQQAYSATLVSPFGVLRRPRS